MHAAVKRLDAAYPLCLSGTPIENNLDELWALIDVVAPGRLGTAAGFRQNYRIPIEQAVRMLTRDPADLFGMRDRGVVETGRFERTCPQSGKSKAVKS